MIAAGVWLIDSVRSGATETRAGVATDDRFENDVSPGRFGILGALLFGSDICGWAGTWIS